MMLYFLYAIAALALIMALTYPLVLKDNEQQSK